MSLLNLIERNPPIANICNIQSVVFTTLINDKLRIKICVHDIVFLYNKLFKKSQGQSKRDTGNYGHKTANA